MRGNTLRPGRPGATWLGNGRVRFEIWAPLHERMAVRLFEPDGRMVLLEPDEHGYHSVTVDGVDEGTPYLFRLPDGSELPDPASLSQPGGVHGPSQVVDPAFDWQDGDWRGLPQDAYVIYELHVGTFSREGTFDGVIPQLDDLRELGITAIELMPIAQFPGERNWGYDGVYPYAAQFSYGGIRGLQQLVDACHARGMAVVLDVVHNHLGPEGNYTGAYGLYSTDQYQTVWGSALNFDGPGGDEVRRFFIESALFWLTECHIDALRCDATDAIIDRSAYRYSAELTDRIHARASTLGRDVIVIAENDLNDPATVTPTEQLGLGYDALWADNYHHALHALLTGERTGYYADYGEVAQFATAYRQGFVYTGQYSNYRQRRHGRTPHGVEPGQFVVCAQNHDQIGNRAQGDRLSTLIPLDALRLAATATILSPFVPLLFMGEEYGETAPFLYFVDHGDEGLRAAVREGRKAEFAAFEWQSEVPDPNEPETFARSRLDRALRNQPPHAGLRQFYRHLLHLRHTIPALMTSSWSTVDVTSDEAARTVIARRTTDRDEAIVCFNFGERPSRIAIPETGYRLLVDSGDAKWNAANEEQPAILDRMYSGEATVPARSAVVLYRKETT